MTRTQFDFIIAELGGIQNMQTIHSANGGIYLFDRADQAGKYSLTTIDDANELLVLTVVSNPLQTAYLPIDSIEAIFSV